MENEEEMIVLLRSDVKECKENCERNLLGKILEVKSANFSGIKNILSLCKV